MAVNLQKYRTWWRSLAVKYGQGGSLFYAYSNVPISRLDGPRSEKVDHLFSGCIELGKRHWAFATQQDRNAFVAEYENAHACPDPMA